MISSGLSVARSTQMILIATKTTKGSGRLALAVNRGDLGEHLQCISIELTMDQQRSSDGSSNDLQWINK